jgi:hypothetical protein
VLRVDGKGKERQGPVRCRGRSYQAHQDREKKEDSEKDTNVFDHVEKIPLCPLFSKEEIEWHPPFLVEPAFCTDRMYAIASCGEKVKPGGFPWFV